MRQKPSEWAEKLPRVLSKRRIPVFIFAFIGVLTVAGACLAAVTAVVLYRTAVHDLTMEEEADGPIALSGPLPNGMQLRLRPLSDGRRVFCIYNNRVSGAPAVDELHHRRPESELLRRRRLRLCRPRRHVHHHS
ncbi:hypothetical protein MRX96_027434 [Rhipicephalus microplus]